jgi:hypothetical protein
MITGSMRGWRLTPSARLERRTIGTISYWLTWATHSTGSVMPMFISAWRVGLSTCGRILPARVDEHFCGPFVSNHGTIEEQERGRELVTK